MNMIYVISTRRQADFERLVKKGRHCDAQAGPIKARWRTPPVLSRGPSYSLLMLEAPSSSTARSTAAFTAKGPASNQKPSSDARGTLHIAIQLWNRSGSTCHMLQPNTCSSYQPSLRLGAQD